MRYAKKGYDDYAKLVEARRKSSGKDESPTVYWNNPEMQQLVDDILNVRVLDPAMGSGHFLVEVVDTISNRLIDFLNGWSENPMWHFIDHTRQDILDDMERQSVSIDPDRLTRVALLKRAVLKRCVYGVDLNLMAVELAKVSLWLDAFTLGAPLSFLDHHLKHGNSLIGARVADVQAALQGQQTLFSQNKFAGVMLATDLMRQVSYLSDNTIEQTRKSAQAYRDARDHLAPYKRVLDVYTSRWFGNAPGKAKKGATAFDPTTAFLQRDDTQAWLEDPTKPENRLPADDYMQAGLVAKTALQAAEEKRFFHWELEFPEVFFAPSKPGGQDVQLRQDGGFDAVVGNPPYDVMEKAIGDARTDALDSFVEYLSTNSIYEPALGGKLNIFRFFVVLWVIILQKQGRFGLIIPLSVATDLGCSNLRRHLLMQHSLQSIDAFPDRYNPNERVFADAKTSVAILVGANKHSPDNKLTIHTRSGASLTTQATSVAASPEAINILDSHAFTYPLTSQAVWDLMVQIHQDLKIVRLSEIAEIGAGEIHLTYYKPYFTDDATDVEVLRGAELQRFELASSLSQGEKLYLNIDEAKKQLNPRRFDAHRVGMQRLTGTEDRYRFLASLIEPGVQLAHTTQFASPKPPYHAAYLLAVLSSRLVDQRFRITSGTTNVGVYEVEQLPFPRIDFITPADERERLVREITGATDLGDTAGALSRVQAALAAGQTDVVHDVLAHLAQTMIDLNKEKQAEVGRFLGWLEGRLKIAPKDGKTGLDVFTGKTIIQGYLGDYQKGEGELAWDDFTYRLHQNKNRYAATLSEVEGEIQREYEASLETLLPVKDRLARTDALIDKIVYRLYGLTDAEIELIERPGYEQALTDAKAQVVGDDKIDDEEKLEKIAEGILPAAKRFFERVTPADVEAALDGELPRWRELPPDAPVFLLTGDYNLRSLPDHMDFSSSVIGYMKAVEVLLDQQVFVPFRQQHSENDVNNPVFKRFMSGKQKNLTLGNYVFIVPSSNEAALHKFMRTVFGDESAIITAFKDNEQIEVRNKAAHDEVLSRDEARQARAWAVGILGMV